MELTKEILEDEGLSLDENAFNEEMEIQRKRARDARKTSNYMGTDLKITDEIPNDIETIFNGYENDVLSGYTKALICGEGFVKSISEGDTGVVVTDVTPFYAEMGGQIGDTGIIYNDVLKQMLLIQRRILAEKYFIL